MKIGIVGAGKVGYSVGKYWCESEVLRASGYEVTGYFSKSEQSVEEAATFTGTKAFGSLEELVEENEIICIATPDDSIGSVWETLSRMAIEDKIVCHFSGSLSSDLFLNRFERNVQACSVHPMYAFSNKFTSYQQLNQVLLTMEGDEAAVSRCGEIWELCGNEVSVITPDKKTQYHAAASMISNMMVGLYEQSLRLLTDCGFEYEMAQKLVKPLVQGNVEHLLATSPEEALTGPIERNDVNTVEKHLKALKGRDLTVYLNLAKEVLEVAKRKNPNVDYEKLTLLLEKNGRV